MKKKRIWSVMAKSEQPQTGDGTVDSLAHKRFREGPLAVSQARVCAPRVHKHRDCLCGLSAG